MPIDRRAKRNELSAALNQGDVYKIASVLTLPPVQVASPNQQRQPYNAPEGPGQSIKFEDQHGLDWTNTLTNYCNAVDAAQSPGNAVKCYEAQAIVHASFHSVFSSSLGNWLVPTLHAICKSTHRAALAADKEVAASKQQAAAQTTGGGGGGDTNAHLQKAVTLLQESYSKTSNDRKEFRPDAPLNEEGSKKAGVLAIVNELFAIYFRLNTLRLCKNLLRPVESRKLHEQGSMSEMVTYKYYVGRIFLFEDQYEAAEESLYYALQHCHKSAVHNKRCILRYLVPVKLYRGRLPSARLLEKYGLHEFIPIVEGVRTGDLQTFHDGLVKYQDLFIQYVVVVVCLCVCVVQLALSLLY